MNSRRFLRSAPYRLRISDNEKARGTAGGTASIRMRRGTASVREKSRGNARHYKFRLFNVSAARTRARRPRETRSGKDITGLSRMTRRTAASNGGNKASALGRSACTRVRARKQVRFIYRVRIGEILRQRREILFARCNYSLDIDSIAPPREGVGIMTQVTNVEKEKCIKIRTPALSARVNGQAKLDFSRPFISNDNVLLRVFSFL